MTKHIMLAALVFMSVPLAAQTNQPTDSLAARGYLAGRLAADRQPVGGRAAGALGGGILLGFFGPLALFGGNAVGMVGAGAGGGAIIAAAESGSGHPPDSLIALASARAATYAPAFARGYSDRLKSRRRSAAFLAGGAGTAVGFGVLLAMLSAAFSS